MGIWVVFLTICSIIEAAKLGLLRNATIKFLHSSRYSENKDDVQFASLIVNCLFTIVIILLILLFGKLFALYLKTAEIAPLLKWAILLFIVQIPFHHCELVQQSNLQFKSSFWAYLLRQGLFFAGVFIFAFWYKEFISFINLVLLQLMSLLAGLIYFLISTRKLLLTTFHFRWSIVSDMLQFGKYVLGTNLFSNLARYTDHFVTANAIGNPVLGKTYVSYYNAVGRIIGLVDLPSFAVADILFPKNVQAIEQEGNQKVRYYVERSLGYNIAVLIPLCTIIFILAEYVIILFAGRDYLPAVDLVRITLLFAFIRPLFPQFGSIMDSLGKPMINFWVNMMGLVLNIIFTYAGYKFLNMGMYGGVFGSMVGAVASYGVAYYFLHREIGYKNRHVMHYTVQAYKDMYAFAISKFKRS